MARIRTIKPEFPQSESMGRVSRDARLTFIELWLFADDSGRCRGNLRMLASTLFPYDDDAPAKIGGWLAELEAEECIRCYVVGKDHYVEMVNWSKHQRIEKPSPSRFPPPSEGSPISHRSLPEASETFMSGSRIEDQGRDQGRDQGEGGGTAVALARDPPPPDDGSDLLPIELDRTAEGVAVRLWNAMATDHGLPSVAKLTQQRRRALRARLADGAGLPGIQAGLARLAASRFCRGENDRGWRANFDWFVSERGFTRLMEGAFDDRPGRVPGGSVDWAEFDREIDRRMGAA